MSAQSRASLAEAGRRKVGAWATLGLAIVQGRLASSRSPSAPPLRSSRSSGAPSRRGRRRSSRSSRRRRPRRVGL
jgi:hypothetical protein